MTSTDTLLPCPFCGEDLIPDATPDGLAEHPSSDCPAGDWLVRPADWNRRTPPTPAAEEREAVALAMLNGKRLREGWPITASIPEGFADGDEWRLEAQDALSALAPIRAAEILAARTSGRNDATKAYLEGVEHGEAAGEANERARIVAWVDQHKAETCPGHCPDKQGIDLVNHGYGNALVNCRAAIERNTAALTANHSAPVVEE